ncbi:PREDICTED: uncharacterized protein LOC105460665 [Wasmannia auropunctata]|uniref:uncharacterized protein LOC105460665 n=1 Tax=Wasmannia auropunctata TaxID=64793 RepID=UPI0005F05808|nr:PREDICTED: uncharacterized protein LOC105460665 [Wasmannia auropunctata]
MSEDINKLVKKLNQSAPGNSRNVNNTTNTDDDSAKIMCHCQKLAKRLVKKAGPHEGRLYYKCANDTKLYGNRCKFFLPVSDSAESQLVNAMNEYSSSVSNMMDNAGAGTSNISGNLPFTSNVMYSCNQPVKVMVEVDSRENTNRSSNSNFGALKRPKLIESKRKCGFCRREGNVPYDHCMSIL